MKILVIGGSYFLGRWFVQLAKEEHELTVLNRGNIPIRIDGVREIVADRHDRGRLKECKAVEYDCIVDFCAYIPGDIRSIVESLGQAGKRYLYISTVDVYEHGCIDPLDEESAFEMRNISGEEGEYIRGKLALEEELICSCKAAGMEAVSVRPSILYGPANYAPREAMYFEWIRSGGAVIVPEDATGAFQMLYVRDAAEGILKLCEMPGDQLQTSYNFCWNEMDTYDTFTEALHKASPVSFEEIRLSVQDIRDRNIQLPFPLCREESSMYRGDRFQSLGVKKTSLEEGLGKCMKL